MSGFKNPGFTRGGVQVGLHFEVDELPTVSTLTKLFVGDTVSIMAIDEIDFARTNEPIYKSIDDKGIKISGITSYTGSSILYYIIEVSSENNFKYSSDGGVTWSVETSITTDIDIGNNLILNYESKNPKVKSVNSFKIIPSNIFSLTEGNYLQCAGDEYIYYFGGGKIARITGL